MKVQSRQATFFCQEDRNSRARIAVIAAKHGAHWFPPKDFAPKIAPNQTTSKEKRGMYEPTESLEQLHVRILTDPRQQRLPVSQQPGKLTLRFALGNVRLHSPQAHTGQRLQC